MPISYRIDDRKMIVREFSGDLGLADFESHWRVLLSDPEVPAEGTLVMLADLRSCKMDLNGEMVDGLVGNVIKPLMRGRHWISAIVVSTPVNYGTTKQFITYSEECGESGVFYEIDEAMAWIETKRYMIDP